MQGSNILQDGIYNWKLRLILSALLCIIGLATLISMATSLFIELSVLDQTIVAIAIFMVGTPAYLIISKLGKVDQYTIAEFLNEQLKNLDGDADVLVKDFNELGEEEITRRQQLEDYFKEHPLYTFLPDRPVKQAYLLFLFSLIGSFGIWYLG